MSAMWYVEKFDEASWKLLAGLGLTAERFRRERIGMASVDQRIEYRRELRAGDLVTIRSSVLDVTEKSITVVHEMRNDETGEVAAATILRGIHFDTTIRKTRALPSDVRERATLMIAGRGGHNGDDYELLELALDCVVGESASHR
jgi:acyl-CoA thioester hydrolase